MLNTPVALVIFRRPEHTRRVLDAVARVQPRTLFVIADGPRADHPDDQAACAAARAVIERVDWPCEVVRKYADENVGCGPHNAAGISWVFDQVDSAIVLEDDCVPHHTFFRYCEELLERYRDDERVMHIAGCTYRRGPLPLARSYCFSCFNAAWGWATWRRAWRHYDGTIASWPALKQTSWLRDILEHDDAVAHWSKVFDRMHAQDLDTWDHQWTFACWAHGGLSILPRHNLVTNVGCGEQATHTRNQKDPFADLPVRAMEFPLAHPPAVARDLEIDRLMLRDTFVPRLRRRRSSMKRLRALAAGLAPAALRQGYRRLREW